MDQVNMLRALQDIEDERNRQEQKFPNQHLPSFTESTYPKFIASQYELKRWVDAAHQYGTVTWNVVLLEEVAEAMETNTDLDLRKELIQVAAVCVRWIEDLDQ